MPATSENTARTLIFLYARISEDPRDLKRGVQRQVADLRAFAGELGGEIAGEFVENDVSAHSGEERPEYDSLLSAALSASKPGVRVIIAAYHPSRLWRRRVERAQAIEDLRRAKCVVAFESGGFFNLSKATDRSQLAQVGESDTAESEVKSERVARAALERAQEGRANGAVSFGWRREYRYDRRGQVVGFDDVEDPETAPTVQEIVRRLLGGESLIAVTESLNARGVPAPGAGQNRKHRTKGQDETGSLWNKTSVKKIALRPANIAIRRHGEDSYPAAWPALITEGDHARLTALFASRAVMREKPGQRVHLLTWGDVAVCGVCGSWLRVSARTRKGVRLEIYTCDKNGCIGRVKHWVDEFVRDLVVERLSRPDALDLFRADDSDAVAAVERVGELRARQSVAADDYAAGLITRDQLVRITESLGRQITEAQAAVRRAQPAVDLVVLDELTGPLAGQRFDAADVVRQRQVLEALGLRLRIERVGRRGRVLDPAGFSFPDGSPFGHR